MLRVSRVINHKEELWNLLYEIKKIDEHAFIACLLGMYTGARFLELEALVIQDLRRERIHLGTQIYLGTGRNVLIAHEIKPYIEEFCNKQLDDKKPLLERLNGTSLKLIEANRVVIQAARNLNMTGITVTSFRKSFGHKLCKLLKSEFLALDATGFKTESKTNLYTMFNLEKGGWE